MRRSIEPSRRIASTFVAPQQTRCSCLTPGRKCAAIEGHFSHRLQPATSAPEFELNMLAFQPDAFALPLPAGHPFPMSKYNLLREAIELEPDGIRVTQAPPASDGELALAHDPAWIAAVFNGTTTAAQQREIGFPWSERMAERARRSVGATVAAARAALFDGEGVAANLAGGTHHAYAHKGSGYCVFNDAAVAARLMQAEWRRRAVQRGESGSLQVWVIDLDVHQGNGTAAIFGNDRSVFTFSMHGARNFPFRKEASDLDIELDDGTGDAAYLAALQAGLAQCEALLQGQSPGLAFYLAGADPHESDRLGRLKLTSQGLSLRDELVLRWLRERRIPVALSMAGGYGRDIALTVGVHRQTLRLACDSWRRWAAECSS